MIQRKCRIPTYKVTYTQRFKKHYKRFHPNEKKQIAKKIELLAENLIHPSLRTKRIQGTENLFECSVNMDIRIIRYYEDDKMIILLDIGHHDILNEF